MATKQINKAGTAFATNYHLKKRFAFWNLRAGAECMKSSDFAMGLYYYENGIGFLGCELWGQGTVELSLRLHEGAAVASFAIKDYTAVAKFTSAISENVSFEDSLAGRAIFINALESQGEHGESITKGLYVLRKFNICIPTTPSESNAKQILKETEGLLSRYSVDQILNLHRNDVNFKTQNLIKIVEAVAVSCYRAAPSYLPLVACAVVNYSLINGIYDEFASSWIMLSYFFIILEDDFGKCQFYVNIGRSIIERASRPSAVLSAKHYLFTFVSCWFCSLKTTKELLFQTYELAKKSGDIINIPFNLNWSMRYAFLEGENLATLAKKYDKYLESLAQCNMAVGKVAAADLRLVNELAGTSSMDPFSVLEESISDENALLGVAESKQNYYLLETIFTWRFFSAFWFGNFDSAQEAWDRLNSNPTLKMIKIHHVFRTFYYGLIAFQKYRSSFLTNNVQYWFDEGKACLDKMEIWLRNSPLIVQNKVLLLRAEHLAVLGKVDEAKLSYQASIESAGQLNFVHEKGLAFEYMGKFLAFIGENEAAAVSFRKAYECYMLWGANGKADHLYQSQNLGFSGTSVDSKKHGRGW